MTLSNANLEMIRRLIRRQVIPPLQKMIEKLEGADLSDLMMKLTPNEQRILITALHLSGKAGVMLKELPEGKLKNVLEKIPDEMLVKIMCQIQADDAAMLLESVDRERASSVLEKLPGKLNDKIEEILRFPSDTAGSLMNTYFLEFFSDMSAKDALDKIRKWSINQQDPIYSIYVLDDSHHLMGHIPLRNLALADPEDTLDNFMLHDPVTVNAYQTTDEAAYVITRYDLVSVPVVDDNHRMVGIIMIDDVIDTMMESVAEQAFSMQGITEEDRIDTPAFKSIKSRFPWMMINLVTAFIASSVVGLFEGSIQKVVALATFMPIVAGLGGNSGTQALAVMVRSLALGEIEISEARKAILRQVFISLSLGIVVGLVTGGLAFLWKSSPVLGLVIFLSMLINMIIGGLVGTGVPLLLKSLGQDPAMGGGVLVTATTDSMGFLCFLGISTLFIQYM
ncbi:MAG: magnesium transporter [Deltaproteobacteria bacterium]|nr:magnesium transporter [Deltaproteobacteria bacterium]